MTPRLAVAFLTLATTLQAQDTEFIKQTKLTGPRVYAFTDTTSVRVELLVPNHGSLSGVTVHGRIADATNGTTLWKGNLGTLKPDGSGSMIASATVNGLKPKRWSPSKPALYRLEIEANYSGSALKTETRIGFRTVSATNGQILLNGRPIFLRGNAINPPERNIPDSLEENRRFVESYIRYLKSVGVNIIRLTRHSQIWFDVCDELGMMLFQGNYGTPQTGKPTTPPTRPFEQSMAWYKNAVLGPLVNHPSVTVFVLSNEQADKEIGYLSTGAEEVGRFLSQAYDTLRKWDPTRVYIANAGYGFGRSGDLCDLHRYWGWYYNSFLSFYTMRYPQTCWRTPVAQPMTMTENTGNYTGVDGRFNLVSNTKQPDSQLNWTGHAPDNEQSMRALAYQAWMGGQAIEIFRRSREQNPNLAGLTPFTILFHNWHGIKRFEDMKPKPIGAQYKTSFSPILLSWENWTSQVYAGATIHPVVHVVNDDDNGMDIRKLSVTWSLRDSANAERLQGKVSMPDLPYYGAESKTLSVSLPGRLATGKYKLTGTLSVNGKVASKNETAIFVAGADWASSPVQTFRSVKLYDPSGKTTPALTRSGMTFSNIANIESLSASNDLLILGAESWTPELARDTSRLKQFMSGGGRILILQQDYTKFSGSWLPVPIRLQTEELDHALVFPGGRPFRNGMSVNPERPTHPVLQGIDRDRLFLWSDYTSWNEAKAGFPEVYPVTRGFVMTNPRTFGQAAVLANYDHGLQGIALAELFDANGGSAMVTGFDLVNRSGLDPVADRMLSNLVRYMASADTHQAVDVANDRIEWGDYASERGVVTGVYNGLLVNTVPVVPADLKDVYKLSVDPQGFWFAGGTSGWNTKPAIQYVAKGRRPFGPFTFTSGGSVQIDKAAGNVGEGQVWLRPAAGRTRMITTVQNPVAEALEITIAIEGAPYRFLVSGNSTVDVETPIKGGSVRSITYKSDRRLVLLSTVFR